jgi:catechol 1,2-dioxygenase
MKHAMIEQQLISSETDVTPAVLAAAENTPNQRLKEIMVSLVTHLHQFILETRPTEEEFERGIGWITALGHHTNDSNHEVVLAADVLGASTLIDLINNNGMQGETMSALLGPFYRGQAPECAPGDCIARSETPGPTLFFKGKVTETDGTPIAGATLDVWQASPVGLYENQDVSQDDFNLRGKFNTDARGGYNFVSVKPAGYPIPTDGPVGVLLRSQNRVPMRPAHVHFVVTAPGHKTLITQIFSDNHEALVGDVVFGAKRQIVGDFVEHTEPHPDYPGATLPFYTCEYDFKLVVGTPTYPVPPISTKKSEGCRS